MDVSRTKQEDAERSKCEDRDPGWGKYVCKMLATYVWLVGGDDLDKHLQAMFAALVTM